MNKVIDTSTRIFMAIVGPSGSGKTELILKLLMGNTFYPKFGTVLYLFKEMQPAFSEKVSSREVNVEFMKFDGFESVRKLENVLLVFDDSCEDIYNDKDVQQLDLLGRQLNISKFLRNCYELATRDSFGHLLIDLDPRTSDCLRYCSNITPPGPTVFYLPLSEAETTPITNEKEKLIYSAAYGTTET